MGPLGELGALFNPGMRHELEERRQKQMLREEEGNARKGDLRIDLESGVAVIPTGRGAANGGDSHGGGENGGGGHGRGANKGGDDKDGGSVDAETSAGAGQRPTNRPSGRNGSSADDPADGHSGARSDAKDRRGKQGQPAGNVSSAPSRPRAATDGSPRPAGSAKQVPSGKSRRQSADEPAPRPPSPAGKSRRTR